MQLQKEAAVAATTGAQHELQHAMSFLKDMGLLHQLLTSPLPCPDSPFWMAAARSRSPGRGALSAVEVAFGDAGSDLQQQLEALHLVVSAG